MVRRERIVNNEQTSLSGAISASVLSITVVTGSVYPTEGDFRILVESEVMLVTARSGNVLTVVRGVDGTSGATHSDAVSVNTILTAGGLSQLMDDVMAGPSARNPLRLLDGSNTTLTSSDFSWVNQGTSTVVDDAGGGITMKVPETSGGFRMQVMTAPSTPYTITAKFVVGPGFTWSTDGSIMGLILRESSTGEFMINFYELTDLVEDRKSVV